MNISIYKNHIEAFSILEKKYSSIDQLYKYYKIHFNKFNIKFIKDLCAFHINDKYISLFCGGKFVCTLDKVLNVDCQMTDQTIIFIVQTEKYKRSFNLIFNLTSNITNQMNSFDPESVEACDFVIDHHNQCYVALPTITIDGIVEMKLLPILDRNDIKEHKYWKKVENVIVKEHWRGFNVFTFQADRLLYKKKIVLTKQQIAEKFGCEEHELLIEE